MASVRRCLLTYAPSRIPVREPEACDVGFVGGEDDFRFVKATSVRGVSDASNKLWRTSYTQEKEESSSIMYGSSRFLLLDVI